MIFLVRHLAASFSMLLVVVATIAMAEVRVRVGSVQAAATPVSIGLDSGRKHLVIRSDGAQCGPCDQPISQWVSVTCSKPLEMGVSVDGLNTAHTAMCCRSLTQPTPVVVQFVEQGNLIPFTHTPTHTAVPATPTNTPGPTATPT